jgi:hypothetical protein
MRFKTTLTLVALLIILGLIAYLFEWREVKEKKEAVERREIFPQFKEDEAATIEIKSKDRKVSLSKKEGKWLVSLNGSNYPAEKEEVENVFQTVKAMKRENVVSTYPAKYPVFEVDRENGVEVKLSKLDNTPFAHFFVGKNGPDLFSTYIRVEGEKEVLLLSGILKAAFYKELKDWRDKTIFNLKSEEIVQIDITSPKKKISLKKDEKGNWEMVEPEKAKTKKEAVEGIVNTLATLKTYDFEDGADLKAAGLTNPSSRIQIGMKDNSSSTLLIGKEKDASKYYVKRADNPTIFLVQKYDLEPVMKDYAELKEGEGEK